MTSIAYELSKYHIVAAFRNSDDLQAETLGTYMLGLDKQTPEQMQAGLA